MCLHLFLAPVHSFAEAVYVLEHGIVSDAFCFGAVFLTGDEFNADFFSQRIPVDEFTSLDGQHVELAVLPGADGQLDIALVAKHEGGSDTIVFTVVEGDYPRLPHVAVEREAEGLRLKAGCDEGYLITLREVGIVIDEGDYVGNELFSLLPLESRTDLGADDGREAYGLVLYLGGSFGGGVGLGEIEGHADSSLCSCPLGQAEGYDFACVAGPDIAGLAFLEMSYCLQAFLHSLCQRFVIQRTHGDKIGRLFIYKDEDEGIARLANGFHAGEIPGRLAVIAPFGNGFADGFRVCRVCSFQIGYIATAIEFGYDIGLCLAGDSVQRPVDSLFGNIVLEQHFGLRMIAHGFGHELSLFVVGGFDELHPFRKAGLPGFTFLGRERKFLDGVLAAELFRL